MAWASRPSWRRTRRQTIPTIPIPPGITLTPEDEVTGLASAHANLALALQLGKPPLAQSLSHLRTLPDGEFFATQLTTAQNVFTPQTTLPH